MISIIICSVSVDLRNEVKRHISETIGVEHEFVIIENEVERFSIAKAYNVAAERSKFPYLCFCHEDLFFHTNNWGRLLVNNFIDSNARLIGVLGSTIKPKYPSSVYIQDSGCNRWNQLQVYPAGKLHCYDNPYNEKYSEVVTLDGLFIASTRKAWLETKFSEDYLKEFHGYDIDFSIKNFLKGKVIVTYDILIEHFSMGSFNKSWIKTQIMLNSMWLDKLPLQAKTVTEKDRRIATAASLKEFIIVLVENKYRIGVQLKYLFIYMTHRPFDPVNLVFLRKIIFRSKRLTNALKSIIKPRSLRG